MFKKVQVTDKIWYGVRRVICWAKKCKVLYYVVYKLYYIIIRHFCPIYPRVYIFSYLFIYRFI